MLGTFSYSNPTKLYFGEDSLDGLNQELPKYGKNVLLVYGGGSIKKSGLYERWIRYHESFDEAQNRTCIRRQCISQILDYEPEAHFYDSPVSDGFRILRYHVPHSGAVFLE